ncbi:hypothetical protein AYL99_04976 [Fonsecaea erecta]|uniref:Aminoglycoside phosphotransferase domain-containing protein n=1 Tax=Fonsecaea erecta TaxID=1367422 RepID=A0A178ZJK4_9EURO|nr:hypothetical protein AYL99_04976 [Fonsecaea erecta]OAP59974.1 hypothetical protein AYL99_04976 [Fonsecaea erecta]
MVLLPLPVLLFLIWRRSFANIHPSRPLHKIERNSPHLDDSVSIPYAAEDSDLPAKIPDTTEILSCQRILIERTGVKVVALGHHFVAKYGPAVNLEEGRTMIFLRRRAQVAIPKVYALFRACDQNFIIMERIEGQTLRDVWPALTDVEKTTIANRIKESLIKIRSLPAPNTYCSLGNKPLRHPLFWTPADDPRCDGPFESESELNDALVRKFRASEAMQGKAPFYQNNLPYVFQGHPPVFTHGDLQLKNMMIRKTPESLGEVVLLDWEVAGWYPNYWEYAQAIIACGLFDDDWHQYVNDILPAFRSEYAWLRMIRSELW